MGNPVPDYWRVFAQGPEWAVNGVIMEHGPTPQAAVDNVKARILEKCPGADVKLPDLSNLKAG